MMVPDNTALAVSILIVFHKIAVKSLKALQMLLHATSASTGDLSHIGYHYVWDVFWVWMLPNLF